MCKGIQETFHESSMKHQWLKELEKLECYKNTNGQHCESSANMLNKAIKHSVKCQNISQFLGLEILWKTQFSQATRNSEETVPFHKISRPEN